MHKANALLLTSVALLPASSGCTTGGGVSLRADGSPGPQECPEESKEAMRYLNLSVGDGAPIDVDVNHPRSADLILYEGPIESVLTEELGPFAKMTRLYGQVWTRGPQVVIRYYGARAPNGEKVPICAVARLLDDQMRRPPESQPGAAVFGLSTAAIFIVDRFW